MDENAAQSTCFLDLPAEIRNDIYMQALAEDEANQGVSGEPNDRVVMIRTAFPYVVEPALLQSNKHIRAETLPIFYAGTFESEFATDVENFLRVRRNRGQLAMLKSVRCRVSYCLAWTENFLNSMPRSYGTSGLKDGVVVVRIPATNEGLVWVTRKKVKDYRAEFRGERMMKREVILRK